MGRKTVFAPGDVRGKFTVIGLSHMAGQTALWKCACECGSVSLRTAAKLAAAQRQMSGCGCFKSEMLSRNGFKPTHGQKPRRLFWVWKEMKQRCNRPTHKHYVDYGARGIKLSDEWQESFPAFRDWALANGYEEGRGLSIDRRDNDGGYNPENCRWTDSITQAHNKRWPKRRSL